MKFTPIGSVSKPRISHVSQEQLNEIDASFQSLFDAYLDLSESQRNLEEVHQVMDNIELSIKMIKSGNPSAIPLLNIDKSLESLVGVPESKLTVESAQEGLVDALKKAWATFVEWLKKICRFIASIFDKLAGDQKITVQASEAAIRAAKDNAERLMAAKTKKIIVTAKEAEFWKTATLEASKIIGKCNTEIKGLDAKLTATVGQLNNTQAKLDEALAWIKPEEDKIIKLVDQMTTYSSVHHGVTEGNAELMLRDLGWNSNHIEEHAAALKDFANRVVGEVKKQSVEIDTVSTKIAETVEKNINDASSTEGTSAIRDALARITKLRVGASRLMFQYKNRMTKSMANIADMVDPEVYEA